MTNGQLLGSGGTLLLALVAAGLASGLGLFPSPLAPLGPPIVEAAPLALSQYFPQTGFFVRNRDGGEFLAEFDRFGGADTLGYPVSRVFEVDGFLHQASQRAFLQWRPELRRVVLANVMDQLHYLGEDDRLVAKGVPRHFAEDDGSGGDFAVARGIRLSWLTQPEIREAYLDHPDPLEFYGLPTSQPERHGPFIAQRFQRGVLQLWVEDVLGMPRPGEVVGALTGDLAKEAGLIPQTALEPEYRDPEGEIERLVLAVPALSQQRSLSCESASAAMAAQYFGVPLTERQIIAELPLDPNPHQGFRGNIDGVFGGLDDYGVYAEPIAAILGNHGLQAKVVYGLSVKTLRQAVNRNQVVIAWITSGIARTTPVVREIRGERVVLVPYEHAVVVKGYDTRGVLVNDPATGSGAYYSNEDFVRATGYFGGMAVVVSR